MQLGPIMRTPAARTMSSSSVCRARPSGSAFGEAGADHDDRRDMFGDGVAHHVEDRRRRHDDDRQIDRVWNVRQPRIRWQALHAIGGRDGSERSGPRKPVARRLLRTAAPTPPSRPAPTTATDSGSKERTKRRPGGVTRARRVLLLEGGGLVEREDHDDDALLRFVLDGEPGVEEHPQHAVVARQHRGPNRGDAMCARVFGQRFEEARADPAALHGVVDEERRLGARRVLVIAGVLRERDDLTLPFSDNHVLIVAIGGQQTVDRANGRSLLR